MLCEEGPTQDGSQMAHRTHEEAGHGSRGLALPRPVPLLGLCISGALEAGE